LGSVREGEVNLNATNLGLAFAYPRSQRFGAIRLSQQALVDASGGGLIQVYGNNVSLADGSLLLIQNQGTQAGGNIRVNAAQSLEVSGTDPLARFNGGLDSEAVAVGRGADIAVSARQLLVQNGAAIVARSYSTAETGNVTVNALDSVQMSRFSPINPSLLSGLSTVTFNSGDAGAVTVSTGRLSLLEGGAVASPTFGTGKSGTVTVNATEAVEIEGETPLFDASNVSSVSLGGDAGAVTINTARLVLHNSGTVNSSALAAGNGGSVTINASESVEISGVATGSPLPSSVGSSAPIAAQSLRQAFRLPDQPSGNSGSVTLNTPRLSIRDGAEVTVSNSGTGSAGTLQVNANSISLDQGSSITAATTSGEGGNINLNVRDFILLRNGSPITTSAEGTGNGGNIQINAGSIATVPTENSDIRANSVNARGGNVSINASGIFGIQFRPQDTPLSDITATGANPASSGTVQLNIEQPNPTSGLVELPTAVVDPSRLIAQGCPATQGNSFVISGRGGLPPNPEQQLDDDADWQDRRRLVVAQQTSNRREVRSQESGVRSQESGVSLNSELKPPSDTPHPTSYTAILEATGWQITPTGEVFLVNTTLAPTVENQLNQLITCEGRQ
jgi:large exoprotein involved in heme utilization and adhesion